MCLLSLGRLTLTGALAHDTHFALAPLPQPYTLPSCPCLTHNITYIGSEGGHTYFFHKVYVGEDVVHRPEPGDGFEEWCLHPGGRLQAWLQRAHVEYVFEGRTRTHVSHTGYWSSGVDVASDTQGGAGRKGASGGARRPPEETLGVWGLSLYGVWETSSAGNHFDLQKGGVFRAEPVLDYLVNRV